MRIIAGIARGMSLAVPRGGHVRPTSDRVRGAVFSSLGDRVVGATVLDLFAGTGALGLEAASRGANAVMFAESASGALKMRPVRHSSTARRRPSALATGRKTTNGNSPRRISVIPKVAPCAATAT